MRELNLNEKEQGFFKQLKEFLLETKSKYPTFDAVSFYQALMENKVELDYLIDYCGDTTDFTYKNDTDSMKCNEVIYINPSYFNGRFEIDLSYYGDYKLKITKHEPCCDNFISLNEEYSEELAIQWKDDLETYRQEEIRSKIEKLNKEIEKLNGEKASLLKEVC